MAATLPAVAKNATIVDQRIRDFSAQVKVKRQSMFFLLKNVDLCLC